MSLLVRRINRAKWEQIKDHPSGDVSADAITNCLKTINNDLSVWRIEAREKLEDALLALITGAATEKLSTLHIVIINEGVLLEKGLKLNNSDGDTLVKDLVQTHKDISGLSYTSLGDVKDLILHCLKAEETSCTFTKVTLRDILKDAIANGRIQVEQLNAELIKKENLSVAGWNKP